MNARELGSTAGLIAETLPSKSRSPKAETRAITVMPMLARELRCSGVCNWSFMVPMRTMVAILSVSATCSPAATGRAEI